MSFLGPKDLARAEGVCRNWNLFIRHKETDQWKVQCQIQLGIALDSDPAPYLPQGSSYKEGLKLLLSTLLSEDVYRRYVGNTGPVPKIPPAIALKRCIEADPCDPTKTIGENYVWMYCSDYIEVSAEHFTLSGPDDNHEAPLLIRKQAGIGTGLDRKADVQNQVLRVPMTINNIIELFKHPKTGNPSAILYIRDNIVAQHGNKRVHPGWICMRKDVIGRNQTFTQQQAWASQNGVILSDLFQRFLFNLLQHARSGGENVYPDGQNPWTYARTSTLMQHASGYSWPSICGGGGPSGLCVSYCLGRSRVGVAVGLSAEVPVLGP